MAILIEKLSGFYKTCLLLLSSQNTFLLFLRIIEFMPLDHPTPTTFYGSRMLHSSTVKEENFLVGFGAVCSLGVLFPFF